ncbi:DUF192 domain-containing protein [Pusillimonas harenae]|uniref:DUF192 domain-containing protein n=1 Tax=Pollutimonas harenae TaxID=657015 RepID=A0A853GRY8_9BURK|nr:DUF192 domain-containing protein [Pollutimonas harenae]
MKLYKATSFWARLRGLHAYNGLSPHTGLYIAPCRAIHTIGLSYPIDVVFLDKYHRVLAQRHHLAPWRLACCPVGAAVVELPGGYCDAHPDFRQAIYAALTST